MDPRERLPARRVRELSGYMIPKTMLEEWLEKEAEKEEFNLQLEQLETCIRLTDLTSKPYERKL